MRHRSAFGREGQCLGRSLRARSTTLSADGLARSRRISWCWAASREIACCLNALSSSISASFSVARELWCSTCALSRVICASRGVGDPADHALRAQALFELFGQMLVRAGALPPWGRPRCAMLRAVEVCLQAGGLSLLPAGELADENRVLLHCAGLHLAVLDAVGGLRAGGRSRTG